MTRKILILLLSLIVSFGSVFAEDKPFDCSLLKINSADQIVCMNKELAALERKLNNLETEAKKPQNKIHSPKFPIENTDWLKGRNECIGKEDETKCLKNAYEARIAEIEARFRLAKKSGPFIYNCGSALSSNLVVSFFQTNPLSLIAKQGDKESYMVKVDSPKGVVYRGIETSFWEMKDLTLLIWGYDKPEMKCQKLE